MKIKPDQLRAFAKEGKTSSEMAKIFGATRSAVCYVARQHNIELPVVNKPLRDIRINLPTDDEVVYGLTSEGIDHIFLPFNFPMPSDDGADGAKSTLTIYNATGLITPLIRTLTAPPTVRIQVVMQGATEASNGEEVCLPEITIDNLELGGISYDKDQVTGHLSVDTRMGEPFPCHTMTPSYCPGLF